ncbi:hypothetical protein MMC25_007347 [Agyrium rufum]|nr:hypothetical protein [Agyrium rufum]
MLSRGTSSASARLRRAKSSASVRTRDKSTDLQHIDPVAARRDAVAAANYAYEHANGRTTGNGNPLHDSTNIIHSGNNSERNVRRSQSVLFDATRPLRHELSITRREPAYLEPSNSSRDFNSSRLTQRRSSLRFEDAPVSALPSMNSATSTPSSYRKIRKVKSMFTPRPIPKPQQIPDSPGPEEQQTKPGRFSFSSRHQPPAQSPLSPQVTTLAYSTFSGVSRQDRYEQDAAIQVARDTYVQQVAGQRLKERPSTMTIGRRRSPKPFRKTVRSSSLTTYGNGVGSERGQAAVKTKGFGGKARDVSQSLKSKLKRVFGRGRHTEESLPSQHVDAQREHFRNYVFTSPVEQPNSSIPLPEERLLRSMGARPVSPLNMPVHLDKSHRQGSIRSISSEGSPSVDRSRVTSWTTSSAAATLTRQAEKKRLSIIQENGGPYQPSSTTSRMNQSGHTGYSVFRRPRANQSVPRNGSPVDSQRIFSALQKRIDEHARKLRTHDEEQPDFGDQELTDHGECSSRESSSDPPNLNVNAKASIRRVPTESSTHSNTRRWLRNSQSVDFSRLPDASSDSLSCSSTLIKRKPVHGAASLLESLTPQEVANRNEQLEQENKRPLREVKSAFFPPTAHYENKTISPFRQSKVIKVPNESNLTTNLSVRKRYPRASTITSPQAGLSGTESESTYSRTTSGRTPQGQSSSAIARGLDSSSLEETGTATIIVSQSTKSHAPVVRSQSNLSTQSSAEWKQWTAAQVANLERQGRVTSNAQPVEEKARIAAGNGHRREHAQLDGDDTQVQPRRPTMSSNSASSTTIPQPLAALVGSMSRPTLKHKTSDQMVEKFPLRFPLIERNPSPTMNSHEKRAPSQPRKRSGTYRRPSSSSQSQSASIPSSSRPEPVQRPSSTSLRSRHQRSRHTPQPQIEITDCSSDSHLREITERDMSTSENTSPIHITSNAKFQVNTTSGSLQSRHSPERIARLRRLQSSMSVGSKNALVTAPDSNKENFRAVATQAGLSHPNTHNYSRGDDDFTSVEASPKSTPGMEFSLGIRQATKELQRERHGSGFTPDSGTPNIKVSGMVSRFLTERLGGDGNENSDKQEKVEPNQPTPKPRTNVNLDFDARVPIPFSVFPSSYRSDAAVKASTSTEVETDTTTRVKFQGDLPPSASHVGREGHNEGRASTTTEQFTSFEANLPEYERRRRTTSSRQPTTYEKEEVKVYEEDRFRSRGGANTTRRERDEFVVEEKDHSRRERVPDIEVTRERFRDRDNKVTETNIDVEFPRRRRETEIDITERDLRSRFQTPQPTYDIDYTKQTPREEIHVHAEGQTIDPPAKHHRDMGYYDDEGKYHSFRQGLERAADRVLHPFHGGHHQHHDRVEREEIIVDRERAPRARETMKFSERGSGGGSSSYEGGSASSNTVTIPCHHIRVGDLLVLQGRPCQVIRITTSAHTGQHRYLGVDLFTKQLHEESSFVSNPAPSVVVQYMLGPVFKQYRVLDIRDDGRVVAMTESGDVKQGLPVIEQGNLWSRLNDSFENGRGSVRVLVIDDGGRELAVDYKVIHGSRL